MIPIDGEDGHDLHRVDRGLGEQGEIEPEQTVGPQLQQDPGQEDRACGGRFDMGIGEPGVEWEQAAP